MTQDQFICAIQLIKKWEKKVCKIYENSTKIFNKLPLEHSPIGREFFLRDAFPRNVIEGVTQWMQPVNSICINVDRLFGGN